MFFIEKDFITQILNLFIWLIFLYKEETIFWANLTNPIALNKLQIKFSDEFYSTNIFTLLRILKCI